MSGGAWAHRLWVVAGGAVSVGIAIMALISLGFPVLQDSAVSLATPGAEHILGTDLVGRDVARGLMAATLTTLSLAVSGTLLSLVVGGVAGILALRIGPPLPRHLSMIGLIPTAICVALILTSLRLEPMLVVVLSMAIPAAIASGEAVRRVLAPALGADYFAAARLAGIGWVGAAQRHLMPVVVPGFLALALELLAVAVLIEVTLSFAGLGVGGTGLSLGTMLRDGQQLAEVRPLLVIAPGVVAVVTALALLAVAHGLRRPADGAA